MAEGFELFHVPQKIRTQEKLPQHLSPPPRPQSHPHMPNDTFFSFYSSNDRSSSSSLLVQANAKYSNPPPLYQLFSDDTTNGVVSVRGGFAVSPESAKLRGSTSVPLGPFTGYASILRRSSFLMPAQQLLQDIFGSGHGTPHESLPVDVLEGGAARDPKCCGNRVGYHVKTSRLMFMLEEVYKRCNLYCQQIQSVVSSFKTVAGLGNAAPFVSSAIRAISNHFGSLKNAILDQLHFACGGDVSTNNNVVVKDDQVSRFWASKTGLGPNPFQKHLTNLHHSVWRSQRGLPEHAVTLLRRWLFEHFLHPYPTDSEKHMLAQQTGLSRTQISNWFINSRVRLWKPLVEEIQVLQTQQNPVSLEKFPQTTTGRKGRDVVSKRSRSERHECSPVQLSERQRTGVQAYIGKPSINNSLESASLGLNLQNNNGVESSKSFLKPIGQPFDLVTSGEAAFKNWF